ncbi:MAG: FHA domain-containing protein [Anaerolineae bacterium]|nr:FHA domain-containing protein [Anaerolineae bacterium]
MITCTYCKHANREGMYFCDECGAPLFDLAGAPATQNLPQNEPANLTVPLAATAAPVAVNISNKLAATTQLALHFKQGAYRVPLPAKPEVTLGRVDASTNTFPDVDLTTLDGTELGVSRRHAIIQHKEDQVLLLDLDSVNGTYVNGQRVLPAAPRVLQDGDEIRLGKLRARIIFEN